MSARRVRVKYLSLPTSASQVARRGFNKLTHGGRVMFGDRVPELNRPNVLQAEPCLTTQLNRL